jgi:glutamate N-acetyltransferase / amino-acid N-acetyltransferase
VLAQSLQDETADRLIAVRGGIGAVPGVRSAGVAAGIKQRKRDLAVIVFDLPQVCAEVVTTNEIKAAPVVVSSEHIAGDEPMRAVVCNSGCANACTGERGERDARATARQAAALLKIAPNAVVVASTGVIGVTMPMDRVQRGLEKAIDQLDTGNKSSSDAAEAIMTTDRVPKLAAYEFYVGEKKYVVGGIAKGSGMISPNMATMLAFVATNLPMPKSALQEALREATDGSFNMISVDGCMSTNDSCYAFAPIGENEPPSAFHKALSQVCHDLAVAMVDDGEGATKLLTLHVTGARDVAQARAVGRAVINSNLVKTAIYGEDPNWGRIIAAAGSIGANIDPEKWSLLLNGKTWVEVGAIEALSEAEAHSELEVEDIEIELRLGIGEASATAWGCDLSKDYVRINASYRT